MAELAALKLGKTEHHLLIDFVAIHHSYSEDYLCNKVIPNAEVRWDKLLFENGWSFLLDDRTVLGTVRSLSLDRRLLFGSAAR